jgi:3-oxoacyl-[acyl-carrier-protein] synthase-3
MTNAELEVLVDTSDQWIRERTGIRERRIADPGVVTSDLCEIAARRALDAAGIPAEKIGLFVVGTATPDFLFPSTATILQDRLGVRGRMAFDLTAACCGFLYGLITASQFVQTGQCEYALVVGAELLSRILNWNDRNTCVLFGDGAGAVVIGPSDDPERGILASRATSDGALWPMLNMPAGGTRMPASHETVDKNLHTIHMEGNEVFKVAVRSLLTLAQGALEDAGIAPKDVDLFIPHQANLRIIEAVGKRLGVPADRVFLNLERYGNTSAASIPIALDEAVRTGRVNRGDVVLLDAFGAGATAAAVCLRW